MSDFLNSLVDRTLHLAAVVQPRLASLFEPPSTAPELEATTMLETRSMSVDSQSTATAAEAVSATISVPIQARQASRPALSETVGVTDAPAHRKTPNAEDRGRGDQQLNPQPSLLQPAQLADQIIQQATFSQTSLDPNPDEAHALHEADPPNSFNAGAMKSSGEAKTYQSRLDNEPEVRRGSPAKDRQPVQPTLISPKSQSMTVPFAAKQLTPTTRRNNAQASIPAEPPETVVVTIGRVDVRAVFTPPTATRQPSRAPVKPMSLDEYLKQQSEVRR